MKSIATDWPQKGKFIAFSKDGSRCAMFMIQGEKLISWNGKKVKDLSGFFYWTPVRSDFKFGFEPNVVFSDYKSKYEQRIQRAIEAWNLRKQGMSYEEIGKTIGGAHTGKPISRSQAMSVSERGRRLEKKREESVVIEQSVSILERKIDTIECFSVRTINCLKNDELYTIAQVLTKTERQLLRAPNFGKKSLSEIKEFLALHDLELKVC